MFSLPGIQIPVLKKGDLHTQINIKLLFHCYRFFQNLLKNHLQTVIIFSRRKLVINPHGFRPGTSTITAVASKKGKWNGLSPICIINTNKQCSILTMGTIYKNFPQRHKRRYRVPKGPKGDTCVILICYVCKEIGTIGPTEEYKLLHKQMTKSLVLGAI